MRSLDVEPRTDEPLARPAEADDPDGPLIDAVADGDMSAAAELIARHADRIFAIGFRMLGDNHSAEDLTQDVFFKIWKNAGKWQPGRARFSTWLHRVTVNLCYDHLRKRRDVKLEDLPGSVQDRLEAGPNAVDALEERARGRRVRDAVMALPDRQRAAITLCHFEGFTNSEAADILETSVEAIESLLTRGRGTLRKLLERERHELTGGE